MLAGGEDPLSLARRIVRIAVQDIGLADPRALTVALAAKDAYHFLGSPEGELALAQATVYLATAPKSNKVYEAFGRAGYGAGYQYAHAHENAYAPQEYLPDALRGAKWYEPTEFGYEKTVKERMEWWEKLKREARTGDRGMGKGDG